MQRRIRRPLQRLGQHQMADRPERHHIPRIKVEVKAGQPIPKELRRLSKQSAPPQMPAPIRCMGRVASVKVVLMTSPYSIGCPHYPRPGLSGPLSGKLCGVLLVDLGLLEFRESLSARGTRSVGLRVAAVTFFSLLPQPIATLGR